MFMQKMLLGADSFGIYMMTRQPGASNGKAKDGLGMELKHPTWRQGLAAEFRESAK